jgi:hypothetical protein
MNTMTRREPLAVPGSGGCVRPRAKTMVGLDLQNAYARLGISPLLATDEIKELINRKRKDVMRRRRTRAQQQFGEEEAEMTRLQAIEDEIGTPKSRIRYDRLNPQNAILTIQPAPQDVAFDSKHRACLATAWLIEELGNATSLPSPESLSLWVSQGLGPDLTAYLSAFAPVTDRGASTREGGETALPDIAQLKQMGLAVSSENGEPTAEKPAPDRSAPERSREASPDG